MHLAHPLHRWLAGLLGAALLACEPSYAAPAVVRPVGDFEAISLRAPVQVLLRQAAQPGVVVHAGEAVQPLVETAVVDGAQGRTLEIRIKRGAELPWAAQVRVVVDVTSLRRLAIAGSGDVSGSGLRADRLEVGIAGSGDARLSDVQVRELDLKISGSGDITVSGRADRLGASIAGSGDIDAAALEAQDATVRIAGSGDAHVRATATLEVNIVGSGDVTYSGQPRLTQRIVGSGDLLQR